MLENPPNEVLHHRIEKDLCRYNLLDRFQENTISMARTTGFTCTAVANLILDGEYNKIGISPPEYLGECFNFVRDYLSERGVEYKKIKS